MAADMETVAGAGPRGGAYGALLLLPPLLAYGVLAGMYPALVLPMGRFLAFFALFLALPSLSLGLALPLGERSRTESFFLGYPAAQVLLFLLIFFGAKFRLPWLPVALPAASLAALPLLLRTKSARQAPVFRRADFFVAGAALVAALAICFIKFAAYPMPTPGHPALFYQDDTGTAAFVWSAVNSIEYGVPYALPWASGFPDYPYHRIYHFTYAFATYAFGVDPLEQILFYWAPAQWLMLAGGVVAGCRRLAGFSVPETWVAVLLLLFSDGLDFNAQTSIQTLAYFHTFFFGLPAFLMLLLALYGHLGGRSKISPLHAAACYFVAAGVKADLLPFVPFALFPVFLYRLFKRLSLKIDLRMAVYFIASAGMLFYTHYSNLGMSKARTKAFHIWPALMGTIGNLITMAYVVVPFLVVAVLAADRDILLRERLRRDSQYHVMLLTFCLGAAVFLKVVGYTGGEAYFYWQARLILLVAFAWLAAHALRWRTRLVAPVVAAVLACGLWFFYGNVSATAMQSEKGMPKVRAEKDIDYDELMGLRWASQNLIRTKVFFTNKDSYLGYYLVGFIKNFTPDYLGLSGMQGYAWPGDAFSEKTQAAITARRNWVEKFNDSDDPKVKAEALQNIEVDYYIHCERQHPYDFSGFPEMRPVFKNPAITIYEIARPKAAEPTPGLEAKPGGA